MNNGRKGEHLLPRLAAIPRNAVLLPARARGARDLQATSQSIADQLRHVAVGFSRAFRVLPVLESLGIVALVFFLAQ